MQKTKTSSKFRNITSAFAVLILVLGPVSSLYAQSTEELQQRIENLDSNISASQQRIKELQQRGDSLQNKLSILREEESKVQAEIKKTEREVAKTSTEIERRESELKRTKELIQENIKVLYKQGDPSTLEMLFSSDNFSDFVNKQEYLDKAKENLNEAARRSAEIKVELEEKQEELVLRKGDLDGQKRELQSSQQQQRDLIAQTQGEEDRYQRQVSADRQAKSEADAALKRGLCETSGGSFIGGSCVLPFSGVAGGDFGQGSYPYANNCMNPYVAPSFINSGNCTYSVGGYYDRQCTSYAYWRRGNLGKPVPGWWGNAGDWASAARAQNFEVNSTPRKGAIGVIGNGQFGHVFIVEEVISSSQMIISQYNDPNYNNQRWGEYSRPTVNIANFWGAEYIHDRL